MRLGDRRRRLALSAVIGLAGVNFLWQLGSSSYFVDEVLSVQAADHPLGGVLHAISTTELTPPAYFYLLHEWLGRWGTKAEWVERLPSAIAGILLVAAVYWLALRLSERRAVAFAAAALTALSPFVLEYAQRAQGYVFVSVAVTVAVAAALEAERGTTRRSRWLAAAAGAAALSLAIHYTAGFVVAPLCVWVATRGALGIRSKVAFVSSCLLVALALVPLALAQHEAIPIRQGVAGTADLSMTSVVAIAQTPFDGRADPLRVLGVLVMVGALLVLSARGWRAIRELALLVCLAAGVPLALLALSAFGARLALTRYAAEAAPFMIVAVAAATASLPRPFAGLLAGGALAAAVAGLFASHRSAGFYADARSAITYIQAHQRPGNAVITPSSPVTAVPLAFYGLERLRPLPPYALLGSPTAIALAAQHKSLWVISELGSLSISRASLLTLERRGAAEIGYRVLSSRLFPATIPLVVALWAPRRS